MTRRTGSDSRVRAPLTKLENSVMQAVWSAAPASVDAVYRAVAPNHDIKEVTVRTLLRRLEQKGYLRHESDGRAYVYIAVEAPASLAARAVRQIVDSLCRGSMAELVSGMVDAKVMSDSELKALEAVVRNRRQRRT